MITQRAQLRYLKMAPRKVRLIANLIKGLPVNQAEAQLMLSPQRAAKPLLKLLRSAVANAENNQKLNPERMVVSVIRVDGGPMLKRFLPRAKGSASPIQRKMSHIFLELKESHKPLAVKFNIVVKKKVKSEKGKKPKKKRTMEESILQKPTVEKAGGWKRFFQRKSV